MEKEKVLFISMRIYEPLSPSMFSRFWSAFSACLRGRGREGDGVPAVSGAPFGGEAFGCGLPVDRVGGCRAGGFIERISGYGGDLFFGYDLEGDGLGGVGDGVAVGAQIDRVGA